MPGTYIESRSPGVGSRGTPGGVKRLTPSIPFLNLDNFATPPPCRVQTACRMDLFDQARSQGIQTEFIDGQGHRRATDAAALKIILDALPSRTPRRLLAAPVVVRAGQPASSPLLQAATLPLQWKIVADLKVISEG